MDLFPQPLVSPAAEVVVDGLPGWQVVGQQPPGAAGSQPVGDGVDQLPAVMDGWAAARLGGRDERGEQLPLGVGQVGWVAATVGVTGSFLVADGIRQPRIIRAFQTPSSVLRLKFFAEVL